MIINAPFDIFYIYVKYPHTHTKTYTHTYICVCVCVCVCEENIYLMIAVKYELIHCFIFIRENNSSIAKNALIYFIFSSKIFFVLRVYQPSRVI